MGMADSIGMIAAGRCADIIALPGDPRRDISLVRQVAFVMQAGVPVAGPT